MRQYNSAAEVYVQVAAEIPPTQSYDITGNAVFIELMSYDYVGGKDEPEIRVEGREH